MLNGSIYLQKHLTATLIRLHVATFIATFISEIYLITSKIVRMNWSQNLDLKTLFSDYAESGRNG